MVKPCVRQRLIVVLVTIIALAVLAGQPVSGQVSSSNGAITLSPARAWPPARELLSSMQAALKQKGSVHLSVDLSYSIPDTEHGSVTGYQDISLRRRRAHSVETDHTDTGVNGLAETIDVARYRARRVGGGPWICTLEKKADKSRFNPTLDLKVRAAVTVGMDTLGNVSLWHVAAMITGPGHMRGKADYYSSQSDHTLVKLTLAATGRSAAGQRYTTQGSIAYSRYGESVSVRVPRACHYLSISGAGLLAFKVQGVAMEPTLHDGQTVWVDSHAYRHLPPRRGDIVIFRAVPAGQPNRFFVKRVIGLPGELVAINHGTVRINGSPLREPYHHTRPDYTLGAQRVPSKSYFVLGDNRNNSEDSHLWGWLAARYIVGKVVYS